MVQLSDGLVKIVHKYAPFFMNVFCFQAKALIDGVKDPLVEPMMSNFQVSWYYFKPS